MEIIGGDMNKREKGNKFEREIVKHLESLGWQVERATPRLMMIGKGRMISRSHDFWGVGDVVAFHSNSSHLLLIQATTNMGLLSQKKRDMDKLKTPAYIRKQIWIRLKGKFVKEYTYARSMEGWMDSDEFKLKGV